MYGSVTAGGILQERRCVTLMGAILFPPELNRALPATAVRTESGIADTDGSPPPVLLTVEDGLLVTGPAVDAPALIEMDLVADPAFPAASFALTFITRLPESPSGKIHEYVPAGGTDCEIMFQFFPRSTEYMRDAETTPTLSDEDHVMVTSDPGEYLAIMEGDVMLTAGDFLSTLVVGVVGITTGVLVGTGIEVPSMVRVNAFRQTLVFG